jgi:DNA topoisomerase-1
MPLRVAGYALVDGFREKLANFRVEPPGLFRGRGTHPKSGTLKQRVTPEDVTINIGPNTPIPKCPEGHKWKGVMHNNKVTWLAGWHDNVNNSFKYLWLAASSRFKGESDMKKYTKAQKLKKHIGAIRENYLAELKSPVDTHRQRATAIWLIDKLALRVGNEKDTSEVADTVGCCSLRVEHIAFKPSNVIVLDFPGKDSMRYFNEVEVLPLVYTNLKDFCRGKGKSKEIFDLISTSTLNDHLKSLMPGLTAKVFRTYNASITLQVRTWKWVA